MIKNRNGFIRKCLDSFSILFLLEVIRLRSTSSWAVQNCSEDSVFSKIWFSHSTSLSIVFSSGSRVLKITNRFRLELIIVYAHFSSHSFLYDWGSHILCRLCRCRNNNFCCRQPIALLLTRPLLFCLSSS